MFLRSRQGDGMVGTSGMHVCHDMVTWYLRDRVAHPLHGLPDISKALGLALPHVMEYV